MLVTLNRGAHGKFLPTPIGSAIVKRPCDAERIPELGG